MQQGLDPIELLVQLARAPNPAMVSLFHTKRMFAGRWMSAAPRDGLPFVTVKTTGGIVFVGPVRTFDSSGDRADRHLVIGLPLTQATYGSQENPPTIWDRVVAALDSFEHMYVTFASKSAERVPS